MTETMQFDGYSADGSRASLWAIVLQQHLSLITVYIEEWKEVYLIDVTTLGQSTFDTNAPDGSSLRTMLESAKPTKVIFDIRNDSDALFSLYGIRVAGIEDLQLEELASRNFSRQYIKGLAKCIEKDCSISYAEQQKWQMVKEKGRRLFDPDRGGNYAVFDERPLSPEVRDYCVQDVTFMPHLRKVYRSRLCDAWLEKVLEETRARILLSQSPDYVGKGRHKAEAPRGWRDWNPTAAERLSRKLLDGSSQIEPKETPAELAHKDGAGPSKLHNQTEIGNMLHLLNLSTNHGKSRSMPVIDDDEELDDREFDDWNREASGSPLRDLTACDSGCGYCGRCSY